MTWGAALVLGGYLLLFPPLFVLAPLAGLLAASRPGTFREWAWIGVAVLWLGLSARQPAGLATEALQAWALFVTAAFVALMLAGRRPLISGALLATAIGLVSATACAWLIGTGWQEIRLAVAHSGWEFCRQLLAQADLSPDRSAGLKVYVNALADGVGVAASLFPALLVLGALPGLALAWAWYHRLASRPTGAPAPRFAEFRFTDELVWAVVLGVAAFVLPVPEAVRATAGNLMMIVGGLYAARGAAVAWTTIEAFPLGVLLFVALGVLFVLPVALGGLFALGLADTWVDFRRRAASADLTR